MFPKGLTIELIDDMIYWKNTTGNISEQDAITISTHIKDIIEKQTVRAVFVDNRKFFGVWPPEVDRVWIDLMCYLPDHVDCTATLCQNHINKLQLDYLSAQAGTTDTVKAFTESERLDMESFLNFSLSFFD